MPSKPDPVVHFEIPADDVPRAQTFYHKALGWTINSIPGMGYTLLHTTPTDADGMVSTPGNINGGMLRRQAHHQHPVLVAQVPDIDASLKAIVAGGGAVVRGKEPVPGVGFAAYFKDPEGNVLGLIQPARR